MLKIIQNNLDDDFIMSPKVDFAFKLLFGDEKNKEQLISLLSAILDLEKSAFDSLELLNVELPREFKEDRKGILDVRVGTKDGKQIDIEVQVSATESMAERTLFYWSKMYNSQIKAGESYDKLKKCVTINITDFNLIDLNKMHTIYHVIEKSTGYKLTDVLEIHFLELKKLNHDEVKKDNCELLTLWMEFINSKSKGAMEILAQKNEDIEKAYDKLRVISQDDRARMAYESREAFIRDEISRLQYATKQGKEEGRQEGRQEAKDKIIEIARNLLDVLDDETIAQKTGLPIEQIMKIRSSYSE